MADSFLLKNDSAPSIPPHSEGQVAALCVDFIDLGNSAGRQEVRYGAELALSRGFAVRAGYNSRTAFTYGLSLGGLNVQVGGQAPLTLASVIRF